MTEIGHATPQSGTSRAMADAHGAVALAGHQHLAWLLQAPAQPDGLWIAPTQRDAVRRAVQHLNNLAGEALAEWIDDAQGARVRLTLRARRLTVALMALRDEHDRMLARFGEAFANDLRLLDRLAVRTSARNQFAARVVSRPQGKLREVVVLELAGRHFIKVTVTRESVQALGLLPGVEVIALLKASALQLRVGVAGRIPAGQNRLAGTIRNVTREAGRAEVSVDLGPGLTGVTLLEAAASVRLRVGQAATLTFSPDAVMIGRIG